MSHSGRVSQSVAECCSVLQCARTYQIAKCASESAKKIKHARHPLKNSKNSTHKYVWIQVRFRFGKLNFPMHTQKNLLPSCRTESLCYENKYTIKSKKHFLKYMSLYICIYMYI